MDAIPSAARVPEKPATLSADPLRHRFWALLPRPVHQRLVSLRRDLTMLADGLAGRHPSPLSPRQPRPSSAPGLTPRTLRVDRVVRQTADAVTLWLRDPSGAPIPFVAGQFFTL